MKGKKQTSLACFTRKVVTSDQRQKVTLMVLSILSFGWLAGSRTDGLADGSMDVFLLTQSSSGRSFGDGNLLKY